MSVAPAAASPNSKFVISANITLSLDLGVKFDEKETEAKEPIEMTVGALLDIESKGTVKNLTATIGIEDDPQSGKTSKSLREFVKAATKVDITTFGDVKTLTFAQNSDTSVESKRTTIKIEAKDWTADARVSTTKEVSLAILKLKITKDDIQPFSLKDMVACFSQEAADQLGETLQLGVLFTDIQFIRVKPTGDATKTATAVQILNGERTLLEVVKTNTLTHVRFQLDKLTKASDYAEGKPPVKDAVKITDGYLQAKFDGISLRMNRAAVFYSNNSGVEIQFEEILGKYQSEDDKARFFDAGKLKFDLKAPTKGLQDKKTE